MSDVQRIDAPVRLIDRLQPVQEQINRLQGELQAALFGAKVALNVADEWQWDGTGWVAPDNEKALSGDKA